jgi:hypothetical protein
MRPSVFHAEPNSSFAAIWKAKRQFGLALAHLHFIRSFERMRIQYSRIPGSNAKFGTKAHFSREQIVCENRFDALPDATYRILSYVTFCWSVSIALLTFRFVKCPNNSTDHPPLKFQLPCTCSTGSSVIYFLTGPFWLSRAWPAWSAL